MISYTPDLRPGLETEPGASFEADSFGGRHPVTKRVRMRESVRPAAPDTTSSFDDTFLERPKVRRSRLQEANNWKFERGVPTNDETSTENYPKQMNTIIDGEHKTLMSIGRITEAMEEDDHRSHILEHRALLANPNLSETQRAALIQHISDHSKKHRKKLKAVAEAANAKSRPDLSPTPGYMKGFGRKSVAKPATTYDVIPQDSGVDDERKRTAGNMAMESRMKKFDRALKVRRSL